MSVWVSEDAIPTLEDSARGFPDSPRSLVALLISSAAAQTIGFNDELFRLIEDDLGEEYPTLVPLRVDDADLPRELSNLDPVTITFERVDEVADLLADIASPRRAMEQSRTSVPTTRR